jgi:hypothetical protein
LRSRQFLHAYATTRTEVDDAIIATVVVVEPNTESYEFQVVVTSDQTTVTGDDSVIEYLHERYGTVLFSSVVRSAVLRDDLGAPTQDPALPPEEPEP